MDNFRASGAGGKQPARAVSFCARRAQGVQRGSAASGPTPCGDAAKGDILFLRKRISPLHPQEKGIRIVSEQLEELQCLPIALPIARRSRVGLCYTTWLAPTIRCRSACLVVVQPNFRLPRHPSMRRAQQSRISQAVCRRATVTRASR